MRLAALLYLLLISCQLLPDYVELSYGYGEHEFDRFGLESEANYGEITAGYVLRPVEVVSRMGYVDGREVVPVPDPWTYVDPVGGSDGGKGEDVQEVSPDAGGGSAPWWADPTFLTALGGLLTIIGGIFFRKEIGEGAQKVFRKKPRKE